MSPSALMRITVNGKAEQTPSGTTIAQLLAQRTIRPEVVTVELNDTIIDRARLGETVLREGDRVELVFYMGGGI